MRAERKDRGWREGQRGRPPEHHEHRGNIHPPSEIIVEGRSPRFEWDNATRNDLDAFTRLAERFGLVVHELAPGTKRVRRTTGHVDLDVAYAYILDHQGIAFNDWVRGVYLGKAPENATTFAGAAHTARVALSRLHRAGRVEKRKSYDGALLLYTTGHAPK